MADGTVVIQIKGDSSSYESAVKGLGQTTQNSLSTAVKGSFIGNLFANAFSKAAGTISSAMDGAISRVDTLTRFPKVMEQIGFSADDAQAAINKMSDHIQGLPTTLDSVVSSTQRIVQKVGDVDQATDIVLAFNDALVAGGQSTQVQSAALEQFIQGVSKGTFEMEEWRSISTAMPGQLGQVAKSLLGASADADQLYNALKNGTVSVDDFCQAFVNLDKQGLEGMGSFAEQAKVGAAGIQTSMDNAMYAVVTNLGKIITAVNSNGEIAGAFNSLKDIINSFGDSAVQAVTWIKENFNTLKPILIAAFAVFTGGSILGGIGSATKSINKFVSEAMEIAGTTKQMTLLQAVMTKFNASNLGTGISTLSSVFSSVGAAAGGLISKLGTGLSGVLTRLPMLFSSVGAPVLIVVAAIAALAAGMAYFFTQTEQGQAALSQIISVLQTGFSAAITTLTPLIQQLGASFMEMGAQLAPVFEQLVSSFAQIAAAIMPLISELAAAVIPILMQIAEVISGVILAVLPVIIPIITQIAEAVLQIANVALPLISSALQVLLPIISGIISVVTTVVTTVISVVTTVVTAIVNFFTVTVPGAIDTLISFFAQLPTNIANFLTTAITAIASFVTNLIANAIRGGSQFLSNIGNFFAQLPGNVANFLSNTISNIISFAANIASQAISAGNGFLSGISSGFSSAVSFISGIPGEILGFFAGIGGWLIDSGASLIDGFVQGIKNAFSNAISAVQEGLSNIRSFFPFSPAKKGPFSGHGYTSYSGLALMRDFAGGIKGGTKGAVSTAKAALGAISDTLNSGSLDTSLSMAGASLNSVTSVDILGQAFMDGVEAITSRLDAINSRLANIENKLDRDTSITINGREFGRIVRDYL